MIVDALINFDFFKSISNDIYEGLKFIQNANADIELGSYPLTAIAKTLVMEFETKAGENGFGCEAHKHVIDVQYCIKGTERIPWSNLGRLEAYTQYDEQKDVTFCNMAQQQSEVVIGNGIFAFFS